MNVNVLTCASMLYHKLNKTYYYINMLYKIIHDREILLNCT